MTKELKAQARAIGLPLLGLSAIGLMLIVCRLIVTGSTRYWFLPWNLLLAWLPFGLAFLVVYAGKTYRWTSWQFVVAFLSWLLFLPNTFYITTDLIHLHETGEVSLLYDAAMMSLFAFVGLLLGVVSLMIVEKELRRGFKQQTVNIIVLTIILLSSFAIYLGRYLRWNSWDVVFNPGSLLLDTADRVLRPYDYPQSPTTTLLFFVTITGLYFGLKALFRAVKKLD